MRQIVNEKYPGVEVLHSNYPVAPAKLALAKGLSMAQMGFIGVVLAGEPALRMIGIANNPSWFDAVQENKIGACMGAWVIGNSVVSSLYSTGAFEVYFDGQRVYSKLETGNINAQALFANLDVAVQAYTAERTAPTKQRAVTETPI